MINSCREGADGAIWVSRITVANALGNLQKKRVGFNRMPGKRLCFTCKRAEVPIESRLMDDEEAET